MLQNVTTPCVAYTYAHLANIYEITHRKLKTGECEKRFTGHRKSQLFRDLSVAHSRREFRKDAKGDLGLNMKKKIALSLFLIVMFGLNAYAQFEARAMYFIGDIKETKEAFDRNDSREGFRLSQKTNNDWVRIAFSKAARANFIASYNIEKLTPAAQNEIKRLLDALAVSANAAVQERRPLDSSFSFKNPALDRLIKTKLGNSATLKYFNSGFTTAGWNIQSNNLGIPRYRFKRGYIYAKDSADEHKFCHLYYISVRQDYAGGGTYGSAFADYESDTLVACPVVKQGGK